MLINYFKISNKFYDNYNSNKNCIQLFILFTFWLNSITTNNLIQSIFIKVSSQQSEGQQ